MLVVCNLRSDHEFHSQVTSQDRVILGEYKWVILCERPGFLEKCGSQFHWTLIAEYPLPRPRAAPLKVDGALVDEFRLKRGLWEAKDEHDDLEKEAKRKIAAGYPTDNIIFQAPERAILYQNGSRQGLNEDISSSTNLV